jgi:radical SAM protein with 4Fe4S-binding SPASM domain
MTTTEASLSQPAAIIDEYIRQGFSSIFLRPISPYGFAVKTRAADKYKMDEWLDFYKAGLEYIISLNQRGLFFREEYTSLILRKMLTPWPTGYVDLQSPAGAGISVIAFNYDGNIYPSDEARMLVEMGDTTFRLGKLGETSYEQVMLSDTLMTMVTDTMTETVPCCTDCGFQPYCGSDPVYHHRTQNDWIGLKPLSGFCSKNMEIDRHLIRLLQDEPHKAEVLRSWIA